MKNNVILIVMSVLLLSGCGVQQLNESRSTVTAANSDSCWHIDITSMNTLRYGNRMVTSDFDLALSHDTLRSYLPYVGQAYRSGFGESEGPLNFVEKVRSMRVSRPKEKMRRFEIDVNRRQEPVHFVVELWDGGRAYVRVRMNDHDPVNYDGDWE